MKRLIIVIMIICIVCTLASVALAREDEFFQSAVGTLVSSKMVTFSFVTMQDVAYIRVNSCSLQKRVGNSWSYVCSLPTPTEVYTNCSLYSADIDYSSYITQSGTYRIRFVPNADGHTIVRYTNAYTF